MRPGRVFQEKGVLMKKRTLKKLANRALVDVREIVFHDHLADTDPCQERMVRLPNGRWATVGRPEVGMSSSLDILSDLRGVRRYADHFSSHGELWFEFIMADGSSHVVTC